MPKKPILELEEVDASAEAAPVAKKPRSLGKKLLLPAVLSAALVAGAGQFASCGEKVPQPEHVAENQPSERPPDSAPPDNAPPDSSAPPEFGPDIPVA